MTLLFDQNLSFKLPRAVANLYPGSGHVQGYGLDRADDESVWAFAAANGFMIVSKDDDFRQRSLVRGQPPKVVWIRLGNCPTRQVESLLRWNVATVAAFATDPVAAMLILP